MIPIYVCDVWVLHRSGKVILRPIEATATYPIDGLSAAPLTSYAGSFISWDVALIVARHRAAAYDFPIELVIACPSSTASTENPAD